MLSASDFFIVYSFDLSGKFILYSACFIMSGMKSEGSWPYICSKYGLAEAADIHYNCGQGYNFFPPALGDTIDHPQKRTL